MLDIKFIRENADLVKKIEDGYGTKVVYKDNRKAEVMVNLKDVLDEID